MFMPRYLPLSALCVLAAAGCAGFSDPARTHSSRVFPFESRQPAVPAAPAPVSAEAAYREALKYHAALRYDAAIVAYKAALQLDPAHVPSRNGLGILLSSLGRHDEAVRELEAAVAVAPHQAHLRNNLGYAHLLRGAHAQAVRELEEAARLDPANPRAEENLRIARSQLPASGKLPAPAPASGTHASPPAIEKPGPAQPATSALILVSPQVYELRERAVTSARPTTSAAGLASKPAPIAASLAPAAQKNVRLEVSNGNGLNGYARRVAAALNELGWNTARLINHPPYQQRVTELQYREGYAAEASRLAASLRPGVLIVRNDALPAQADVRLVLGRDLWTPAALVRRDPGHAEPVRVVASPLGRP